jgi:hypothetical protein
MVFGSAMYLGPLREKERSLTRFLRVSHYLWKFMLIDEIIFLDIDETIFRDT